MKKETFLHKLTNWLAALGFAAVCGCIAVVNNNVQKASAYTVEKNQRKITFTKEELNNCTYSEFNDYLLEDIVELPNYFDTITYNNETYFLDDWLVWYAVINNQNNYIKLQQGQFGYFIGESVSTTPFTSAITMNNVYTPSINYLPKQTILSANQLNNNTYEYLANQLTELISDYTPIDYSYIIYNNRIFKLEDLTHDKLYFIDADDLYIELRINNSLSNYAHWVSDHGTFTNSLTIYSTWIADNIYAPFTDGDDIIGGITSGLGLISYLATAFLNGFTGLFWQNNALTNFAMYSLIMLGIAICFSVIKLCMNIMRSNTGA